MKPLVYRKSRRARRAAPRPPRLHIAKGDTVRVIRGEHRGREGKVLKVYPKRFRAEVEGITLKKHKRASGQDAQGGIIDIPAPLAASNLMLIDPKSGEPTRVRRRRDADGVAERIAVKSGQPIPRVRAT